MPAYLYQPSKIIIDDGVKDSPFTQQICKKFAHLPQTIVSDFEWSQAEAFDPEVHPLTRGKKTLHLKEFKGAAIRLCPGTTEGAICCNYFTIDFIENCPFECTYCILQAFLNKPIITVHANLEQILAQVKERVSAEPKRLFRIGTGEHSDSLALDPILGINQYVIPFFAKLPNAILELKTKSDFVDHLLDLPHGGKTVISWSLNPAYLVDKEELKTASLQERLQAMQKVSQAGYKIAIHLDPMIYYPDWKSGYFDLLTMIFDLISPKQIAWLSMGTLRYIPKLKKIVEQRFPQNELFLGEFIKAEDGKMRYLKKVRQAMFEYVQQHLQTMAPDVPTYLCMEKQSIWNRSMPSVPTSDQELELVMSRQWIKRFENTNDLL